jgi:hypothetical protein
MGNPILNELSAAEFYFFDPQRDRQQVIFNFLFSHPEHLLLQSPHNWKIFGLRINDIVVAQMAFHIQNNEAASPLKAPFGSLQSTAALSQPTLTFFLENIEVYLRTAGCRRIAIKNYPEAYADCNTRLLFETLRGLQFDTTTEISSIIGVDQKDFESMIRISEKQKLRKSKGRFKFQQTPLLQLPRIYDFIHACRLQKKQTLSMSLPELYETAQKFNDDFLLFEVCAETTMAAAAVVIRVNKNILYTFYYAHHHQFDPLSPVVFLLSGIYSFAQEHGYRLLDLGTSMNGDKVNASLLHFKECVGGKPSAKYVFKKELA